MYLEIHVILLHLFRLCSTALCFTCSWYSSIITGGLLYLLLAQILNISFNVTEREVQQALRSKKDQRGVLGLRIHSGEHSRGFFQNWVEFLTMAEAIVNVHSKLTDLVWFVFLLLLNNTTFTNVFVTFLASVSKSESNMFANQIISSIENRGTPIHAFDTRLQIAQKISFKCKMWI